MTRNELLLMALARTRDGIASTAVLADLASLPERTARRGLLALTRQSLVWSPNRGRWRMTPAGREIAASLIGSIGDDSATESLTADHGVLANVWSEGLAGLWRHLRPEDR